MTKTLLVVDSPRKAKTLARWLARDVRLVACSAPARALPRDRMGVDVKQGFALELEIPKARQKEVRALVAAAADATELWFAAAPGAAGEAFCSLTAGTLSLPRAAVRRLELSELTEEGLGEAIRGRRPIDEGPAEAEEAREVLDRLAGPALARGLGEDRVRDCRLGRLDALALALLCDREQGPDERRLASRQAGRPFPSASGHARASPLTIIELLEACFETHGLSARQALRLAERLHEGVDLPGGPLGLITSPRSDGADARRAAVIRPTSRAPEPSSIEEHLSRAERWLYRLVWEAVAGRKHDSEKAAGKPARRGEGPWTEPDLVRELVETRAGPAGSCLTVAAALEEAGLVEGGPAALRPTAAGRRAAARLREGFPDLVSAPAAAALEGRVAGLARGEQTRLGLYGTFWKRVQQDMSRPPRRREDRSASRPEGPPCERCGEPTLERNGPYGPFRACSNYPSCTNTRSLDGIPRAMEVGVLCPRCSSAPIVERLGPTGRLFYGCRGYPKCRFTTHHRPVAEPCPRCGQAYLLEKSTRREGLVHVCGGCRYRTRVATTPEASNPD